MRVVDPSLRHIPRSKAAAIQSSPAAMARPTVSARLLASTFRIVRETYSLMVCGDKFISVAIC